MKHCTIAARIRPLLFGEEVAAFSKQGPRKVQYSQPDATYLYSFDHVFEEESNQAVYDSLLRAKAEQIFAGRNLLILAYGQTGSGKTHTIFGHGGIKGLNMLTVEQLLEGKAKHKASISGRFIQIYNECPRDLLTKQTIRLFQKDEQLIIDNCKEVELDSYEDFVEFYATGQRNKQMGTSYVHDKSSRSHTLCMLRVTAGGQSAEFNLVDLCGMEVLDLGKGASQNKETNMINLSLLSLNAVVDAITSKEKFIPFRNSVLTRLLKCSLSGDHSILIFCNISPALQHSAFSRRTLAFGGKAVCVSKKQKSGPGVNLSALARQSRSQKNVYEVTVPEMGYRVPDGIKRVGCDFNYYCRGDYQRQLVLVFHAQGGDCSAMDWPYVFQAFSQCFVVAVDFPGFGGTKGARPSSRTQKFDEPGQTTEFIRKVFNYFTVGKQRKVILAGYDYGGNVALHIALHKQLGKFVSRLVLYHPNYTADSEKLAKVRVPVLLFWVKSDVMHLIKDGLRMAKTIPDCKLYSMKLEKDRGDGYYDITGGFVAAVIRAELFPDDAGSVEVIQKKVSEQELALRARQRCLQAIKGLREVVSSGRIKEFGLSIKRTSALTQQAIKIFGELPVISEKSTLEDFKQWGLFADLEPVRLETKYPCGRQLHVKVPIDRCTYSPTYMHFSKEGEPGLTCLASCVKVQGQHIWVDVKGSPEPIRLNLREVNLLNGATNFNRNFKGSLVFEDGVASNYESLIARAKLWECAIALDRKVQGRKELDLACRVACAREIWSHIDLIHLVHQGINPSRLCEPDAGKLALYGQGNCHHLAGVAAAFLLPFARVFNWQVKFRAGFFRKIGRDTDENGVPLKSWDGTPRKVQDHTWLQMSHFPEGQSLIYDPTTLDLGVPFQAIYCSGKMCIGQRLACGSQEPCLDQNPIE